jgi:hypothetical protein
MDARVWVVAGCLFEVSLPDDVVGGWRWTDATPAVTLLAQDTRDGRHHFRFRAEAAGALAGTVRLRFSGGDGSVATVDANVAPERVPVQARLSDPPAGG